MSQTVLVVDDQPSLRQMVRFSLQLRGYQVLEAADGVEALDQLSQHQVAVVVTDLRMPRMDGEELINRIRVMDWGHKLPIIMISCERGDAARRAVQGREKLTWLRKPFRLAEIQEAVEQSLDTTSESQSSAERPAAV